MYGDICGVSYVEGVRNDIVTAAALPVLDAVVTCRQHVEASTLCAIVRAVHALVVVEKSYRNVPDYGAVGSIKEHGALELQDEACTVRFGQALGHVVDDESTLCTLLSESGGADVLKACATAMRDGIQRLWTLYAVKKAGIVTSDEVDAIKAIAPLCAVLDAMPEWVIPSLVRWLVLNWERCSNGLPKMSKRALRRMLAYVLVVVAGRTMVLECEDEAAGASYRTMMMQQQRSVDVLRVHNDPQPGANGSDAPHGCAWIVLRALLGGHDGSALSNTACVDVAHAVMHAVALVHTNKGAVTSSGMNRVREEWELLEAGRPLDTICWTYIASKGWNDDIARDRGHEDTVQGAAVGRSAFTLRTMPVADKAACAVGVMHCIMSLTRVATSGVVQSGIGRATKVLTTLLAMSGRDVAAADRNAVMRVVRFIIAETATSLNDQVHVCCCNLLAALFRLDVSLGALHDVTQVRLLWGFLLNISRNVRVAATRALVSVITHKWRMARKVKVQVHMNREQQSKVQVVSNIIDVADGGDEGDGDMGADDGDEMGDADDEVDTSMVGDESKSVDQVDKASASVWARFPHAFVSILSEVLIFDASALAVRVAAIKALDALCRHKSCSLLVLRSSVVANLRSCLYDQRGRVVLAALSASCTIANRLYAALSDAAEWPLAVTVADRAMLPSQTCHNLLRDLSSLDDLLSLLTGPLRDKATTVRHVARLALYHVWPLFTDDDMLSSRKGYLLDAFAAAPKVVTLMFRHADLLAGARGYMVLIAFLLKILLKCIDKHTVQPVPSAWARGMSESIMHLCRRAKSQTVRPAGYGASAKEDVWDVVRRGVPVERINQLEQFGCGGQQYHSVLLCAFRLRRYLGYSGGQGGIAGDASAGADAAGRTSAGGRRGRTAVSDDAILVGDDGLVGEETISNARSAAEHILSRGALWSCQEDTVRDYVELLLVRGRADDVARACVKSMARLVKNFGEKGWDGVVACPQAVCSVKAAVGASRGESVVQHDVGTVLERAIEVHLGVREGGDGAETEEEEEARIGKQITNVTWSACAAATIIHEMLFAARQLDQVAQMDEGGERPTERAAGPRGGAKRSVIEETISGLSRGVLVDILVSMSRAEETLLGMVRAGEHVNGFTREVDVGVALLAFDAMRRHVTSLHLVLCDFFLGMSVRVAVSLLGDVCKRLWSEKANNRHNARQSSSGRAFFVEELLAELEDELEDYGHDADEEDGTFTVDPVLLVVPAAARVAQCDFGGLMLQAIEGGEGELPLVISGEPGRAGNAPLSVMCLFVEESVVMHVSLLADLVAMGGCDIPLVPVDPADDDAAASAFGVCEQVARLVSPLRGMWRTLLVLISGDNDGDEGVDTFGGDQVHVRPPTWQAACIARMCCVVLLMHCRVCVRLFDGGVVPFLCPAEQTDEQSDTVERAIFAAQSEGTAHLVQPLLIPLIPAALYVEKMYGWAATAEARTSRLEGSEVDGEGGEDVELGHSCGGQVNLHVWTSPVALCSNTAMAVLRCARSALTTVFGDCRMFCDVLSTVVETMADTSTCVMAVQTKLWPLLLTSAAEWCVRAADRESQDAGHGEGRVGASGGQEGESRELQTSQILLQTLLHAFCRMHGESMVASTSGSGSGPAHDDVGATAPNQPSMALYAGHCSAIVELARTQQASSSSDWARIIDILRRSLDACVAETSMSGVPAEEATRLLRRQQRVNVDPASSARVAPSGMTGGMSSSARHTQGLLLLLQVFKSVAV